MDFVGKDDELEVDVVGSQGLDEAHGLGESHVPVVVTVNAMST